MKKAQRDTGQTLRMYVVFLRDTLENDVLLAFRNYTATLLTKEPGICVVRQKYLQMDPNTVVQEVNLINIFFIFSVVNEKDKRKKFSLSVRYLILK